MRSTRVESTSTVDKHFSDMFDRYSLLASKTTWKRVAPNTSIMAASVVHSIKRQTEQLCHHRVPSACFEKGHADIFFVPETPCLCPHLEN